MAISVEQQDRQPINLDAIFSIESSSGKNKKAYQERSTGGPLGGYQISKIAFDDLQQKLPQSYKMKSWRETVLDDTSARQAASDYLNVVIPQYLIRLGIPPTPDNILAAYNYGIGNFKNAYRSKGALPKETRDYISKYNTYRTNAL